MVIPRNIHWHWIGPASARTNAESRAAFQIVARAANDGLLEIRNLRYAQRLQPEATTVSIDTPWAELAEQLDRLHRQTGEPMLWRAARAAAEAAECLEYATIASEYREYAATRTDLKRAEQSALTVAEALRRVMAFEYRRRSAHRPQPNWTSPECAVISTVDTAEIVGYLS